MSEADSALGPYYDFSNELQYPSEIGIRRDGDIFSGPWQIIRNAEGMKYYVDSMAFGSRSGGLGIPQSPLGLNYFFKTGLSCSNGADMYQYMSTVSTGLPGGMGAGLQKTLGANLQGLAPGVLQDSYEGLNPTPMLKLS